MFFLGLTLVILLPVALLIYFLIGKSINVLTLLIFGLFEAGILSFTYPRSANQLVLSLFVNYPSVVMLMVLIIGIGLYYVKGVTAKIAATSIVVGTLLIMFLFDGVAEATRFSTIDLINIDKPVAVDINRTVVTQPETAKTYVSQTLGDPSFAAGDPVEVYGNHFHGHVAPIIPQTFVAAWTNKFGFFTLQDGNSEAQLIESESSFGIGKDFNRDVYQAINRWHPISNLESAQFYVTDNNVTTLIPSVSWGAIPLFPKLDAVYSVTNTGAIQKLSKEEAKSKYPGSLLMPQGVADHMVSSLKYRGGFLGGLLNLGFHLEQAEPPSVVTLQDGKVGYLYSLKLEGEKNKALVMEAFVDGASAQMQLWDASKSQIISPDVIEARAIGLLSSTVWARGKGGVQALDLQMPHEVSLADGNRAYLSQITPTNASTILAWLLIQPTNSGFGVQVIDRLADVSAALEAPSFQVSNGFEAPESAINLNQSGSVGDNAQVLAEMQRIEALITKLQKSVDELSASQ
jgi:hypothetical protein